MTWSDLLCADAYENVGYTCLTKKFLIEDCPKNDVGVDFCGLSFDSCDADDDLLSFCIFVP